MGLRPTRPIRPFIRRWMPVLGACIVGAIAYGGLYCFPPISVAYAAEFGSTRTLAVTPWTVFLLVSGLSSPLLGRAYDVFLDRQLLAAGMALVVVGWVVAALAVDVGLLVVAYGIFLAVGLELIFIGTTTAIARRYAGATGLALGIAYAGPAIGVAIGMPLVTPLVAAEGWRAAMWAFAAISLAGFPFVLLATSGPAIVIPVRPRVGPHAAREPGAASSGSPAPGAGPAATPAGSSGNRGASHRAHVPGTSPEPAAPGAVVGAAHEPTTEPEHVHPESVRRTLRTRRFWVLFAGAAAIGMVDEGVFQTYLPHATSRGINPELTAAALGLSSVAYMVGQVAGGGLSDRIGRRGVGIGAAFLLTAGTGLAVAATSGTPAFVIVGLIGYGAGIGTTIAVRSATFSDVFGGPNFGAVFGVLAIAYPLGGIVPMYLGGLSFDATGSYWPVFGLAFVAVIVWSGALWVAGPRRHGRALRLAHGRIGPRGPE